jgi:carboxyl-terminal processing protease
VNADSIKFPDSLKFKTPKGKIVYGGGGIMPDLFVPLDTSGGSTLLNNLFYKDVFTIWSLSYAEKHNAELTKMGLKNFRANFAVTDALINELLLTADKAGVARNEFQLKRSSELIKKYMKASIARNVWGDAGYLQVWNEGDMFIEGAVGALRK